MRSEHVHLEHRDGVRPNGLIPQPIDTELVDEPRSVQTHHKSFLETIPPGAHA